MEKTLQLENTATNWSVITVLVVVRSDRKTLKPLHYVQDFPYLKARPQDPISMIRSLLVPKIGSCEHSKNDLLTHGSVILKERTGTEHALFSLDTLLAR